MKKILKVIATLLLFLAVIPLLAGLATAALWNNILTPVCGFSAIDMWQGVGIFILGQILSGGFILGSFFAMGGLHHAIGHRRGDLRQHWHNMTDEERRAFIEQRASFRFRRNHQKEGDVAE